MDLEMVLNELSLRSPAADVHVARQRMIDFVQTILVATKFGVKRILRTSTDFNIVELAPGYPVIKWLNDNNVDREIRRFYLTLATKAPFLDDVNDSSVQERYGLSDFFCGEDHAIGLGVAYLLDSLAVSLRSGPLWLSSYVELKISVIDEDGELSDSLEQIPHASHSSHIHEHRSWINARLRSASRSNVNEGSDIWFHREEWFPHLYFCEQVKEQLQELSRGDLRLFPVLKRMHELEEYCVKWLDGPFDHTLIVSKVSPESPATLEEYGVERTYLCHDGEFRKFSWHVRLTPGEWRLYFYPLPEERKLIIGYIGPHLPTVRYTH